MASRNRTNAEWEALIRAKIAEVEADASTVDHSLSFRSQNLTDIAKYIDHTALKPESTQAQIDQLCDEARQYGFKVYLRLLGS
jgi:deoxyribose-phosphate aldolase